MDVETLKEAREDLNKRISSCLGHKLLDPIGGFCDSCYSHAKDLPIGSEILSYDHQSLVKNIPPTHPLRLRVYHDYERAKSFRDDELSKDKVAFGVYRNTLAIAVETLVMAGAIISDEEIKKFEEMDKKTHHQVSRR